ncbi:MAG: DEAD/DEAH box helicase, partial [Spirochaetaceae bacterium]|nr:DEAD/DEAH box helicase [Spirochaetaceae bacterium]
PLKTGSFYGGVGYGEQQQSLRAGADVLVGTPGRVLDLNASGEMNLMDIAFLILDEADRMFDMGFYPDLRKLIKVVPSAERRQTMLFSATLNVYVKNLALEYTKEPVEIEIEPEHITVEEIDQRLYHVPSDKKFVLLLGIFAREKPESAIIFCNTKRYTEVIARRLRANGIHCEFMSGDLQQKRRLEIINDLKAGKYQYLVATDVAARGLDIEGLALVVNYDLPAEPENYVHRIGRTARAGANGKAVSFASEQDVYELADIEKYIENKIPSLVACPEDYADDKERPPPGVRPWREGSRGRDRGYERGSGDGRRRDAGYQRNAEDGRQRDEGSERSSGDGRRRDAGYQRNAEDGRQRDEGSETRRERRPGLSQLSLEERLAYYKEKYDNGGASARKRTGEQARAGGVPAWKKHEEAAPDAGGDARKRRRRGGGRNRTEREQGREQERFAPAQTSAAGASDGAQQRRRQSPAKSEGAAPASTGAAKKGLISRIASLFGKKDS